MVVQTIAEAIKAINEMGTTVFLSPNKMPTWPY